MVVDGCAVVEDGVCVRGQGGELGDEMGRR